MTTLVLGATGATGRLLVQQLLDRGEVVRVIVRAPESLPEAVRAHERCEVVHASLLDLSDSELGTHLRGCRAVVSCLGHRMTFAGVFGPPWRLVTEALRRVARAARSGGASEPVRLVLMSTTGVRDRALGERISFAQTCVIALLRLLVPPHADNERAAAVLQREIAADDPALEWVAVRPDGLTDADAVTAYDVHPSPTRSAIFDAGSTSRINVAHFMANLVTGDEAWRTWKGRMPVIYDREASRG